MRLTKWIDFQLIRIIIIRKCTTKEVIVQTPLSMLNNPLNNKRNNIIKNK